MLLLAAGPVALAQESQPAAREPVAIDLATPQSALASYLCAQQAIDMAAIEKTIQISPTYRRDYVECATTYQLWSLALERAAVKAFGGVDGIRVEGHARSLDDQITLDLERLKTANVEYNDDQTAATIFLPIEKDRPAGLQIDRFNFIDVYKLRKTNDGWKIDYVRTYDCNDASKEQQYKFEQTVFSRMAGAIKKLVERLKKGEFKTADDLKAALDGQWKETYDAMEKP